VHILCSARFAEKHHSRKRIQVYTAQKKSDDVKWVKLADKTTNMRASRTRAGAPTLVPVETGGNPVLAYTFGWLRRYPKFARKYTFAKRFQIQWLADEMVDIADHRANNRIDRDGPDGKQVRVFDHENFRNRKRQIGEVQRRISKLKPKRYHW
jgi:hypothetical protein